MDVNVFVEQAVLFFPRELTNKTTHRLRAIRGQPLKGHIYEINDDFLTFFCFSVRGARNRVQRMMRTERKWRIFHVKLRF